MDRFERRRFAEGGERASGMGAASGPGTGKMKMSGDEELRKIFARESAPPGFAERVMAAAAKQDAVRRGELWRRAIAAVLLVCCALGVITAAREQQRRAREQAAAEQLRLGLAVTGRAVGHAEQVITGVQIQVFR